MKERDRERERECVYVCGGERERELRREMLVVSWWPYLSVYPHIRLVFFVESHYYLLPLILIRC